MVCKILNRILPAKDQIKEFVPMHNLHCFLCDSHPETYDHLLFECLIVVICWIHSPWQIDINHYATLGVEKWLEILFNEDNQFQLEKLDKRHSGLHGVDLAG